MYTYKFVDIKHSCWTGRPKENLEEVIEDYAAEGWRLVQVVQDYAAMWYRGRVSSKLIFEKRIVSDSQEPETVSNRTYSTRGFV